MEPSSQLPGDTPPPLPHLTGPRTTGDAPLLIRDWGRKALVLALVAVSGTFASITLLSVLSGVNSPAKATLIPLCRCGLLASVGVSFVAFFVGLPVIRTRHGCLAALSPLACLLIMILVSGGFRWLANHGIPPARTTP